MWLPGSYCGCVAPAGCPSLSLLSCWALYRLRLAGFNMISDIFQCLGRPAGTTWHTVL
uniref:Uncharacterized protein n=1 Tax=Anguilla anguilla TaxID=7936 RepID=A0A0E9V004_ANGAN